MRERVARARVLVRRAFSYWKMSALLFVVATGIAFAVAMNVKRVYRSEVTIIAKPGLRTDDKDESSGAQRTAKLTGDLKDALTTESHLEAAIQRFHLYGRTVEAKGLKDAADEMAPHVGFRAKAESGRYVISFDSSEVDGGKTQDLVKDVTEFLAKTLIADYASGDLKAKQDQLTFDENQETTSNVRLEKATKDLATFLLAHPEFAMDAKQATSTSPLGVSASAGMAAAPKQSSAQAVQKSDPELAALYQNDAQLGALWRQRMRLQAEANAAATLVPTATAPAPTSTAAVAALDDQINASQGDVEAAAKRVAEAQADLSSKQATLGPDNPDLRSAQNTAGAAAGTLRAAKVRLATLQAQKVALTAPPPSNADNPYTTQPAQTAQNAQNAELAAKLKDVDSQIGTREAEIKRQRGAGGAAGATTAAPTTSASAASAGSPVVAPLPEEPINPIVQLETEYLRLFRELTTSKATNERSKLNHERSQLAVEAAQAAANDVIAIEQHAYRPTSPSKGGRTPAAAAGLFVAMMLALLYAGARVAFNDALIDAYDVEALQLIPVIGIVPKLHMSAASASATNGNDASANNAAVNRGVQGGV